MNRLPAHLKYSLPCTGKTDCPCPSCADHPSTPSIATPTVRAFSRVQQGMSRQNSTATEGGSSFISQTTGAQLQSNNPFLQHRRPSNGSVSNLSASNIHNQLPSIAGSPSWPESSINGALQDRTPSISQPSTQPSTQQQQQQQQSSSTHQQLKGTVPLELIALQTENDADRLPSYEEYWVKQDNSIFYIVTKCHGPKQRRFDTPKTWFKKQYYDVDWNEFLS